MGTTANTQDNARVDISVNEVWEGRHEKTCFDVGVFNPHTPSHKSMSLRACFKRHEKETKQDYGECVWEMEHSTFTPLVLTASGGLGPRSRSNFFYT